MDDKEKKRWFITAIIGTVFMGLCLVISIMQYFVYKISAPLFIERYIALFINLISFFCFVVLIFTPTHFGIYFVIFYLYGCGNLLDQGNILGALCIFISILFLKKMNLLKQKKTLKLILLSILPSIALATQIWSKNPLYFMVSVLHVCGLAFMIFVIYIFFYPQIHNFQNMTASLKRPLENFSDEDMEWLSMLAKGEKYASIGKKFNVSESKVKQKVLELYKTIGVHDKVEFMKIYHDYQFPDK
ncbi:MAG: hypothetical protein II716_00435 [Treponema sp.]|nr:hypothetical protein [Treponema sp.]MBQ5384936.1 hypothetical protein [Treponema sp.]